MTLDEAIKHCEEVADGMTEQGKCIECANEHKQLAEWLKDYKRLLNQQTCKDAINKQLKKESKKRDKQAKELQEYIKNKIIILDREIFALQAKKDAYHDIELELYGCVDNEKLEQPDKCKFVKDADCCYPIEDCDNCPNHKESE